MSHNEENNFGLAGPHFMPDENGGVQPAKDVMTDEELIRYLRIDTFGLKNEMNTLRYYRRTGKLKSSKISNRNVTTIEQAIEFLKKLQKN